MADDRNEFGMPEQTGPGIGSNEPFTGSTGGYGDVAGGGFGEPAEQGREDLGGRTQELGEEVQDRARELGEEVQDRARELGDKARERAEDVADRGRMRAASGLDRLGNRLDEQAHEMEERGGVARRAGQVASRGGEALHESADYMRTHDLGAIRDDLTDEIRTHPLRSVGIALGAGYLVGRLLR
jgi:ElaB/YqjD/DUF883 family membrane-anchored ribosome-binding protein